jgi:hypothetical protein
MTPRVRHVALSIVFDVKIEKHQFVDKNLRVLGMELLPMHSRARPSTSSNSNCGATMASSKHQQVGFDNPATSTEMLRAALKDIKD